MSEASFDCLRREPWVCLIPGTQNQMLPIHNSYLLKELQQLPVVSKPDFECSTSCQVFKVKDFNSTLTTSQQLVFKLLQLSVSIKICTVTPAPHLSVHIALQNLLQSNVCKVHFYQPCIHCFSAFYGMPLALASHKGTFKS